MKLQIYKSSNYSKKDNIMEIDCKGNGTKEDPMIIDASVNLPQSLEINESEVFILIRNCTLSKLRISIAKNITLKGCYIDRLEISDCSNIEITDVISELIALLMSNNCVLERCEIERELCMSNSSQNVIKNCIVKQRLDYNLFNRSRDNRFEGNTIPERYLNEIFQESTNNIDQIIEKQIFTIPDSAIEFECTGKGIKEDPFIFTPQVFYMNRFSLMETVHYVLIKNFNLRYIFLGRCKNKFIEDSKIKFVEIDYCSNVKIDRTEIKSLWFNQIRDVLISDCTIDKLKLKKSFDGGVIFKNCSINKIKGKTVDKIKFENTIIQK